MPVKRLIALLFLLLSATFAQAQQCTNTLNYGYYVVGDTNPGSQVFLSTQTSAAFVANSDATFQTWLTSGFGCLASTITSTADNGAGLIRVTVPNATGFITGQYWVISGTSTAADGKWQITSISSTTFDLVGSTWDGNAASTGSVYGPGYFGSATALYAAINSAALSYFNLVGPSYYNVNGSAVDVTLTDPAATLVLARFTGGGLSLILPPANTPTSTPIGVPYMVNGDFSGATFTLKDASGGAVGTIRPGDLAITWLTSNATAAGTRQGVTIPFIPQAGTLYKMLIDNGSVWQNTTLAGDCTVGYLQSLSATVRCVRPFIPLAGVTGGTYAFDSNGTSGNATITTSGGVITGATVFTAGSGYRVGDVLVAGIDIGSSAGNRDAYLRVETLSGSGIATLSVLYGGTGYSNGNISLGAPWLANNHVNFTLTGVLASNATFKLPANNGAIVGQDQLIVNNNTTGAFTVKFILGDYAGGTIGSGVTIPQGSNLGTQIWTPGATDVYFNTAGNLAVGTTAISGGTTTRILYDNAGVLGEYTLTGTGTVVAMQTSPVFVTDITTPTAKLSGTSNQLIFQSAGVTGTISWSPATSNKTITLPNGSTDFTATGGTSQVLKQVSAGAAITVAQLAASDLSNGTTGTAGTAVVLATSPTIATPVITTSATVPLIIGGSGTTGTQMTLQTTTGSGTTDAFSFVGGNNGGTTFATLRSTGFGIGAGTTTPGTFLDLNKNAAAAPAIVTGAIAHLSGADNTSAVLQIDAFGTSAFPQVLGRRALTSGASPSAIGNGSAILYLGGRGYGATGYASSERAYIVLSGAETWTDSAQGTKIQFATTPNGGTSTAAFMTLSSAGSLMLNTATDPAVAGVVSSIVTSASNTSKDGLVLTDSTAATAANQQYSPRIRLTGQGWKTTATAASQAVDWIIENQPTQDAATPGTTLAILGQENAGGYLFGTKWIVAAGGGQTVSFYSASGTAQQITQGAAGGNNTAWYTDTGQVIFGAVGALPLHVITGNTSRITFPSGSAHINTDGTAPALTSCGTGSPSISGSDVAGTVTMGTSATGCVITFNVSYTTAPYCVVTWQATPLASQSYAISATAITLTQTSTSGNKVNYHCIGVSGGT